MASQLQQALRSLCCNTPWKYAVFWKLTHRARMMLTWEDAYYDNDGFPGKKSPDSTAGNLYDGHYSNNHLGVAVAKMSYHVYSLGEGIVGQVAITGKHLWLSANKVAAITNLAPEHCDGWQAQFSAGIKTIVVAAVAPHGVVQLGSLDSIPEDLRAIKHIRDVFSELQELMTSCLRSSMQHSMENSCLSEISTRTSGSEIFQDCVNNLGRSVCEDRRNMWSPLYTSFEKSVDHSCIFLQPGGYPNKILEVVNNQRLHRSSVQGSDDSTNLLPASCESSIIKHQEEGQMWEETDPKFEGQTSNLRVLGKGSVDKSEPNFKSDTSIGSVSYDAGQVTECPQRNRNNLASEAYNDRNRMLGLSDLPNAYADKCAETNLGFGTECNDTMHTPFRFCAGYELYEALGPVFQKGNSSKDWEAGKREEMAVDMLEGIGTSSLVMSNTGNEHLLEAVIANVNRHDNDCSSVKSFCKSVDSLLTTEITAEPCSSDIGTISSTGYSFDRETLNSFNSSGTCSIRSSRGLSSTSCSRGSGHVERPLEPVKMHKKRARPGESCRPRPRDRQLIQDRIKELRDLVPNGSKCSIDSLLERTIKHMLFMQSVTKHADKLSKCSASKLADKESGICGSSSHEVGSSWAVEVGNNQKVCPMRVENLGMNGQMLVEIFEDGSHFLDIAEAIRSLGLTILKGLAEAYGERTRMCFVVDKCMATELLGSIDLYKLKKSRTGFYPRSWEEFQNEVVTEGSNSIKAYLMKVMNARNENDALPTRDTVESDSECSPHLQATVLDLDNDLMTVKSRLIGPPSKLDVVSIVGMGGIGKTTLARKVYDDIYMEHHFYVRAWITVSQMHQHREMLLGILRCFSLVNDYTYLKSTEQLAEQVYRSLKGRRYLIAMDDVWDTTAWDVVKRSFPDDKNGSRVILTSRLANVGIYASSGSPPHYMRCLSVDRSLKLFNLKVFGRENCPLELEKATKQIVGKCQGLPLAIVVVAGFCSKISKTENCWEDVAHKIGLIVSRETEECMDLLALSYKHLPHHLKPCFLYMGAFPKDYEISVSRLIKLWIAAEFLEYTFEMDFEEVAEGYLKDLIDRSLIMVKKRTSSGKVKTCEVHDLLHDLIIREAWKERSIYFTKSNVVLSPSVASFEHRIIFNFNRASSTHLEVIFNQPSLPHASSFLCFGRDGTPGSCSQVDSFITFTNFTWLTVLDISFQPFDHLPCEIWQLFSLRYLALASFTMLPPSICNLRYLQTLIRYSHQASICLPAEIWEIEPLRHLYFRKCCYFRYVQSEQKDHQGTSSRSNLGLTRWPTFSYHPSEFSRSNLGLTKLQTLSYITFGSIKRRIFKGMPKLKKLGIRESEEEHLTAKKMSRKLKKLVLLEKLETLKCFFIKPWILKERDVFPPTLKKLTLRGCQLPWNQMTILCMLPELEVLKLKDYAFQGSEWESTDERFQQLKFLLLDGTDLIHWIVDSIQFPKLESLVLKNCYCLSEIPDDVAEIPTLQFIELYHCSSSADVSANRIQEEQHSMGNDDLVVRIHKFCNPET